MGQDQGRQSKGNGASKRMSNARRKARMVECFNRGVKRAAARNAVQVAAHKVNVEAGVTPWQVAKADRKAVRAALITRWGSMEEYRQHVQDLIDTWAEVDMNAPVKTRIVAGEYENPMLVDVVDRTTLVALSTTI